MKKIQTFFKPSASHKSSEVIMDGYQSMETKELRDLPRSTLIDIIYRYDNDIIHLNQEIKIQKDRIAKLRAELSEKEKQAIISQAKNYTPKLDHNNQLVSIGSEDNESKIKEFDYILEAYKSIFSQPDKQINPLEINFNYIKNCILDCKKLNQEIKYTRKTYKVLTDQNDELKEKCDILKRQIEILNNENHTFQEKLKDKENILSKFIDKEAAKNKTLVKLKETKEKNKKIIQLSQNKIEKLTLENYELLDKQLEFQKEIDLANEKLTKALRRQEELKIELKNYKFTNKGQEIKHGTLFTLKLSLEKLYKKLLNELSKNNNGESSFYALTSESFTGIERQLNDIIMQVQESLGTPRVKHSRTSSHFVSSQLLDCVSPKPSKQVLLKQNLQQLMKKF